MKRPRISTVVILSIGVVVALPFVVVAIWFIGSDFEAPERKAWASNREQFQALVANLPPEPTSTDQWTEIEGVPPHIGPYEFHRGGNRVKGGAIFFDSEGCGFIDDSGFAYLPDGPYPELENGSFERPVYKPLGDGWYSFCASW